MKMRRVKLRVNHSQLLLLSREETSGNFQKQGTLRVGRQKRDLSERFCRLRGNLLFILKKQGGKLEEVLLLERCEVMKLPDDDRRLAVVFVSSDPAVFLESSSSAECASWLAVLRDANTEAMRRRIASLRTLINTHTSQHTHTAAHCSGGDENIEDAAGAGGVQSAAKVSPLHLRVECRGVVAVAASRVKVQVCVIDTHTHTVRKHCCCKMVEGPDDSVFLTSVCFRGDYPLYHHSRIKVNVYHQEEPTTHATRSFLGFTSFSIRDLFRSKEPHISLSLRTIDGVNEVGEVKVSRLQMEGETPPEHECPALCESLHGSVHDKENSPMMRAVLCAQVCKVYRFQTEDQRWLLVREQMSETPLSFSLPKQLLSALIHSHTSRIQEVKELGDLSPHWDGLRHDVINHCNHLIGCYQETLAELDKLSASSCFKSSGSKSNKHLQFVPTNLHSQRMEVTDPDSTGVWYEVITFGAPADHHQAFKHGGLKRLLSKHTNHRDSSVSYSQDESSRARELLASVAELQPLVFGLAEELLSVSLELSTARLQLVLDGLARQTEQFVHALKDDLVKSALLTIHSQFSPSSHVHSNGLFCDFTPANQEGLTLPGQQDNGRRDAEYDEEEWDRAWANVAMSLNCIIAMGDRLQGREERPQAVTSSEQQEATGDTNSQNTASSSSSAYSWQEQLLPLVVTLRDCVREAVGKARVAMTFVVLQGAVATTVAQGPAHIVQRRHAVFSQALSAVVCGFMLKLYGGLEDPDFLLQLHSVGLLVQFEGLLSTYGDEVGMLGDMEVGVADLSAVAFTVTEAKTEEPNDLLPTLSGAWGSLVVEVPLPSETFGSLPQEVKDGGLIRVHPVLFNIGINQQQSLAERFGDSSLQERVNQQSCECLKAYCNSLRDALPHLAGIQSLSDLLFSLDRSVETKKRKNVEVLWTAASVCRKVNGVRLTSCKSAKDRTAMSVTLEQCVLLRERHSLSQQHFSTALDCMRRDGCRMENVQKNIGSRKFAFSGVQLLTFPKLYRPPDGSFG